MASNAKKTFFELFGTNLSTRNICHDDILYRCVAKCFLYLNFPRTCGPPTTHNGYRRVSTYSKKTHTHDRQIKNCCKNEEHENVTMYMRTILNYQYKRMQQFNTHVAIYFWNTQNCSSCAHFGAVLSSGANSQISWGGKSFYDVGTNNLFVSSCQTPRVRTPYIEVNSCILKGTKAWYACTFWTLNQ